jgi:ribosomal protein S18 acetylase RimI-like enzyme
VVGSPTLRDRSVGVRPCGPDDEAFLVSVFASTRPVELAALAGVPEFQATFATSQSGFQEQSYRAVHPDGSFDVVLVDGVPAGRLYVDRSGEEIRVVDIALLGEFRGAGIGSRLIQGLLDEAAARGVPVGLEVDVSNPARALYDRLGFVVIASTEVHVSMRWTPGRPAGQPVAPGSS